MKLFYIKEHLSKLRSERRQRQIGFAKYNEAILVYAKLDFIVSQVHEFVEKSEITTKEMTFIHKIGE